MRLQFTEKAIKEIRKIGPDSRRIRDKIKQYAADPASLSNNVKALKGRDEYRLRIGDHRVLFTVDNDVVTVHAVRKRGEAYDR